MTLAVARRPYIPESAQVARSLLVELKGAHQALLAEMTHMESLTRQPILDEVRFLSARWKISQASLRRRTLSARICDYFLTRCDASEIASLRDLRESDRDLLRASAGHVAGWSNHGIAANWSGYCAASRQIRVRMHAQVSREQDVLYPLLERSAKPT